MCRRGKMSKEVLWGCAQYQKEVDAHKSWVLEMEASSGANDAWGVGGVQDFSIAIGIPQERRDRIGGHIHNEFLDLRFSSRSGCQDSMVVAVLESVASSFVTASALSASLLRV